MLTAVRIGVLGVVAAALTAGPARAQYPVFDPWIRPNPYGYNPYWNPYGPVTIPAPRTPPLIGYLPNGTPVVNPWVRTTTVYPIDIYAWNSALAAWNAATIWNPALYGSAFGTPYGTGVVPPVVPALGLQPGVYDREPGRFVRVGADLAVNPVSGTVIQPYRGVALTNEGPFYRLPGSGSLTAWGAFRPGSGVYVNPFTGVRYNPQTGLIVR